MTYELTNQEKINIIGQHMKTLLYTEYNNNINLIQLNAIDDPDQSSIDNLNIQIAKTNAQKAALQKELDLLNSNIEVVE